jgi:predicted nucleotidyltransferase
MMEAFEGTRGAGTVVADIIEQKRQEIAALCRTHRVRALWVFGSATTDAWDSETSDIDFLVDLGEYESGVADRFLDLADDLESIVGRSIDLVTVAGLAGNPPMERRVHAQRVMLYESDRLRAVV